MPILSASVQAAEIAAQSLSPGVRLSVRIGARPAAARIQAAMLRVQARIDPAARSYGAREREALIPVFGPEEQWSRTMRPLLWARLSTSLPPFSGETTAELVLPITVDLLFGPARYLYALVEGAVPLRLLVESTVFHETADRGLQVLPAPAAEASFDLPVETVRAALEQHTGRGVGIVVSAATFQRLDRFRGAHALAGWDETLERLLREST